MKKILTSLILCISLVCGVFVFASCDDKKDYEIKNLKTDFSHIADDYEFVKVDNNKIEFDYTMCTFAGTNLKTLIDSNAKYGNITKFYNPLLNNALYFTTAYVETCSGENLTVDKGLRNEVKANLSSLKESVNNTCEKINDMVDKLNMLYAIDGADASVCLYKLEDVYVSYTGLIESALKLSNSIGKVYFNNVLANDNPNYYTQSLTNFDSSIAISLLDSKIKNQVVSLTEVFYSNYVVGADLGNKIVEEGLDYSKNTGFTSYLKLISDITTTTFTSSDGDYINTKAELKTRFYNNSVKLYNLQEILKNDKERYEKAENSVSSSAKQNVDNATEYEKECMHIISSYMSVVKEYNGTLVALLGIITESKQ